MSVIVFVLKSRNERMKETLSPGSCQRILEIVVSDRFCYLGQGNINVLQYATHCRTGRRSAACQSSSVQPAQVVCGRSSLYA